MQARDKQLWKAASVYDFLMQLTRNELSAAASYLGQNERPSASKQALARDLENLYLYFPALVQKKLSTRSISVLEMLCQQNGEVDETQIPQQDIQELRSLGMVLYLQGEASQGIFVAPLALLQALVR